MDQQDFLDKWASISSIDQAIQAVAPKLKAKAVLAKPSWSGLTLKRALALAEGPLTGPFFLVLFNDDKRVATDRLQLTELPLEPGSPMLLFEPAVLKVMETSAFTHYTVFNEASTFRATNPFPGGSLIIRPQDDIQIQMAIPVKDLHHG
jgi:hypothetical protein